MQAAVTPLGDNGIEIIPGFLILNMYTAVGWVIVVLSVLCFVLLLPSFFHEKHIATKEAMSKQGISLSLPGILFPQNKVFLLTESLLNFSENTKVWKANKPDYLAAFSLIMGYFVLVFNISLLEK